jgi:hypothetical protein
VVLVLALGLHRLLNSFGAYYRVDDRMEVRDVFGDVYKIDVLVFLSLADAWTNCTVRYLAKLRLRTAEKTCHCRVAPLLAVLARK